MTSAWAIVDCNNFYASCERVFNPKLENRPLVVLSNNDGIVIARSEETKALGIPMGAPVFQVRNLLREHGVLMYSSNYTLYGDMSSRVMMTLMELESSTKVYSIDEAFMRLSGTRRKMIGTAKRIRAEVKRRTGIPVSIGIGATKTLAKVANRIAKKDFRHEGVFSLYRHSKLSAWLDTIEVGDIWGVGRGYRSRLLSEGVGTARLLRDMPDAWIQKTLGVNGLRIAWELRGRPCTELTHRPRLRKSVVSSRSFGRVVTLRRELGESVASHIASATETLREERLKASVMTVFVSAKRHKYGGRYPSGASIEALPPTSYTPTWIELGTRVLDRLWVPGAVYRKAGIMMTGLLPEEVHQRSFFDPDESDPRRRTLMQTLDRINGKWGRHTLQFAAAGTKRGWTMRSGYRSPRYTTSWSELPLVK